MLTLRDQVLDRLVTRLGRGHDDAPLGLVILAKFDATLALADDCEILRLARLEQFSDTRQTARDVARFVRLAAHFGDRRAGRHLLRVLHDELRARRDDEVAHALLLAALLLNDLDVRVELLFTIFNNDSLTKTGELVELFRH